MLHEQMTEEAVINIQLLATKHTAIIIISIHKYVYQQLELVEMVTGRIHVCIYSLLHELHLSLRQQ